MRLAAPALLLICAASAAAAPSGRPDGPVRERFDARGPAAPRTRLILAPHAAGALTAPAKGEPAAIARAFVESRLAPAGELVLLGESEGAGGVRFIRFEQRFGGLPVALGRVEVAVREDGSVLAAKVGELASAGPPRSPPPGASAATTRSRRCARLSATSAAAPRPRSPARS